MSELIREQYKPLIANIENKHAAKNQINAAKYIHEVAAMSGINIDSWDIVEIFKDEGRGDNQIITNKRLINRIMFKYDNQQPENKIECLPQTVVDILNKNAPRLNHQYNDPQYWKNKFDAALNDAQHYDRRANEKYTCMRKFEVEYNRCLAMQAHESPSDFPEKIDKVLKDGFFVFDSYDEEENKVHFSTAHDIILTYKNDAQGINCNVNMGKFSVRVSHASLSIYVHPKEGNITVKKGPRKGVYHPHVYDYGLCWGATRELRDKLKEKRDLQGLMQIVASILVSYNPEDAYADIVQYYAKQNGLIDPYEEQAMENAELAEQGEPEDPQEQYEEHEDENEDDEGGW